jgi:hypothetical protein
MVGIQGCNKGGNSPIGIRIFLILSNIYASSFRAYTRWPDKNHEIPDASRLNERPHAIVQLAETMLRQPLQVGARYLTGC